MSSSPIDPTACGPWVLLMDGRPLQKGLCRFEVLLKGPGQLDSDAKKRTAVLDTGCALLDASGKYDVGLVLPRSWFSELEPTPVTKKVRYRLANGATGEEYVYFVHVQVVGDNDRCWPAGFTEIPAIFLDRPPPALVGRGLWGRWKLKVDGPAQEFSLWVPDDFA